jgi:hypothetical protein
MTTIAVAGHGVAPGRLRAAGGETTVNSEEAQDPARQVGFGRAFQHNAGGKAIPDTVGSVWSTEKP